MWQQLSTFLFYAGVGIAVVGFFLIGMPRTPRNDDYVAPIGEDDVRRSQQRRVKQVFIVAGVSLLLIGFSAIIQMLT